MIVRLEKLSKLSYVNIFLALLAIKLSSATLIHFLGVCTLATYDLLGEVTLTWLMLATIICLVALSLSRVHSGR